MTDLPVEQVETVVTAPADDIHQVAAAGERIEVVDAVRGLAVIGMLLRNVFVFGMPATAFAAPLVWSGEGLFDISSWVFVEMAVDGSMRALFCMLFGASALMILQKSETSQIAADGYHRRMMWLMAFGLIHSYILLSTIDILFAYGILGLMLYPLRNLQPRNLLLAAGAGLFVFCLPDCGQRMGQRTGLSGHCRQPEPDDCPVRGARAEWRNRE